MINSYFIGISVFAGFIATTGMTLILESFRFFEVLHVDAIEAIGSRIGGSLRNSFSRGILIHYIVGIFFALLYTALLVGGGVLKLGPFPTIAASTILGSGHGLVISFLVVISIGEHHPVRKFRPEGGVPMGAIYFLAHAVYGALIGLVVATMSAGNMQLLT